MPLRYSRRTRRPRMMRRKRTLRRRIYTRRRYAKRTPVHLIKRTQKTSTTIAYNANTTFSYSFKLDDLVDYTDFTNLFDQYKISGIKVEIIPRGNSAELASNHATQLMSVIDRSGMTATPTENILLQYQSLRKTPLTRKHTRYFKPAVLVGVADPSLSNAGLSTKVNQWLNCTEASVPHYGMYGFIADPGFGANTDVDVYISYYLAFRCVK